MQSKEFDVLQVPEEDGPASQDPLEEVAALRMALWKDGYRPIPVYNYDDSGPSPGKRPKGLKWQEQAKSDPPKAVSERPQADALNTGLLCNGLRAVDIDIDDHDLAAKVRQVAERVLGPGPVKTRSNSAKSTILYRALVGEPRKVSRTGAGHDGKVSGVKVEVLGADNQMVAFGTHASGVLIEWENGRAPGRGVPLNMLTAVSESQVEDFLAAISPLIGVPAKTERRPKSVNIQTQSNTFHGSGSAEPEQVAAALAVIPNDGPANWEDWKRLGMAVWSATGGSDSGYHMFASWSAKNPAHDEIRTLEAWEEITRSPPNQIGVGTLYYLATQASPGWKPPVSIAAFRAYAPNAESYGWSDEFDPEEDSESNPGGFRLPRGFTMTDRGLFFEDPNPRSEKDAGIKFVAAPFQVLGECRDMNSGGWGIVLSWTDPSGVAHETIVPRRSLPGRDGGSAIAGSLEEQGLRCSSEPPLLRRFLINVRPGRVLRIVQTTGWHRDEDAGWVYALSTGEVFGDGEHNVILHPDARRIGEEEGYAETLQDWQDHIARYAIGNSRLAFFISAAFTGALLNINAEPSGGFHLIGKSRSGKSTSLFAAGSVWGKGTRKVSQWRATANGLEGMAKASSDGVLLLDEIGQANGKEAGDAIYMLANEMGKQRANIQGGARERASWRTLFLSTGEVGLETKMNEANRAAATGLHVRLVNLEADARLGLGAFEVLHDKSSPAELADHLRSASSRYYGTAIREFLKQIVSLRADGDDVLRALIDAYRVQFRNDHVPSGADGQVLSVAGRFSLVAAAGELATVLGICPWQTGEALTAAGKCFSVWLAGRGHSGAGEDEAAIKHLRRFVTAHGSTRFAPLDAPDEIVRDRIGWRKITSNGTDYLFQKDQWDTEVFRGTTVDPRRALEALDRRDLLNTMENRLTYKISVGGQKLRVVWVRAEVLED